MFDKINGTNGISYNSILERSKIALPVFIVLSVALFILSFIIPKKKKLIVLGSSRGLKFNGNPKYILLKLNRKYRGFSSVWLTRSEKVREFIESKGMNSENSLSLKAIYLILIAEHIVIDNTPEDVFIWPFLFGRFNVINTWHGIPIKRIGKDSGLKRDVKGFLRTIYAKLNGFFGFNRKQTELMSATSEVSATHMNSAFSPKKVWITGYPRNDILFDKSYSLEKVDKKYGLEKYKQVFLYAPTFRPESAELAPFSYNFLKKLNDYLKMKDSVLLFKAHLATAKINISGFERIVDVNGVDDIQEILQFTDVLISDYSGAIVDFCLTKKPIIFYCYDLKEYSKKTGLYYNLKDIAPMGVAENEKDLFNDIKKVVKIKTDKSQRYNQMVRVFHKFSDGKSSERFIDAVLK